MAVYEFELERVIAAPIEAVFDRLADIEGHHDWMPHKRTIFRATEQTSPGPPRRGTTYVDRTSVGSTPGEIAVFERPTRLVYHWWEPWRGRVIAEGWPGYELTDGGDGTTRVRHTARLQVRGARQLAMPVYRVLAKRERTTTLDALQASFAQEQ